MAYAAVASNERGTLSDAALRQKPTDFEEHRSISGDSSLSLIDSIGNAGGSEGDSNSDEDSVGDSPPNYSRTASEDSLRLQDYQQSKEKSEPAKSTLFLFILTLSVGGLQIAWATENSNGTPYLQSLGMSKSLLALVWIAGPLTGVLVQPYVGMWSDRSRSRWGKRRPFMVVGALATSVSFLFLAWAKEIVTVILGLFGANPESDGVKVCIITFAIICVYVLDTSINTVQAGIRAFIVDSAPYHQQEDANAWAGRLTGVGNILGFLLGSVDLPKHFPWLGKTQIQVLCATAAFAICATVLISAIYVQERDPRDEPSPHHPNIGLIAFFTQTFRSAKRMPAQIRKICVAQFFNWLGWFGFLFYMTTYVGQVKLNPYFDSHRDLTPEQIEEAWEKATHRATFPLILFAIASFSAIIILPFFVVRSYAKSSNSTPIHDLVDSRTALRLRHKLTDFTARLQIRWLTLRRAWLMSHLMFALCMFSTFLVFNYAGAAALTAFIGIPWAMSLWAPFALIAAEVSKRATEFREARRLDHTAGEQEDQAGVIMGLHNVAISAPQILATIVASIIFKIAQKPRGEPYDNSVGWVLSFGGVTALIAAFFTSKIDEDGHDKDFSTLTQAYGRVEQREPTGGNTV